MQRATRIAWRKTMTLHKLRIALVATLVALASASTADTASAAIVDFGKSPASSVGFWWINP
jgi:hypothetical protein